MIVIRDTSEDDIPVIALIAEKTWWPTYSTFLTKEQIRYMLDTIYAAETLRVAMRDGSQTFLMLCDEHGPQGFASYGHRPEDRTVIKLHKIYVLPENQGKGYGAMLIREIIRRISQQRVKWLDLNVNRYNPAKSFYEKLGFSVLRQEDIPIGDYWMNDYVMRLAISNATSA